MIELIMNGVISTRRRRPSLLLASRRGTWSRMRSSAFENYTRPSMTRPIVVAALIFPIAVVIAIPPISTQFVYFCCFTKASTLIGACLCFCPDLDDPDRHRQWPSSEAVSSLPTRGFSEPPALLKLRACLSSPFSCAERKCTVYITLQLLQW